MNASPGPRLDPTTLYFAISMFGFLTAAIAISAARPAPSYRPALVAWSKAMAAAGAAFLLYFLRGVVPSFLTFAVANVLVILVPAYGLLAHCRLFDIAAPRHLITSSATAAFLGAALGYTGTIALHIAIALLSVVGTALISAISALLLWQAIRRRSIPAFFGSFVAGLMSLGFGARAVVSFFGDAAVVANTSNNSAQIGPLLLGAAFVVAGSIAFFAMVHERLLRETQESARRDGLTGVCTRTAFFEAAAALQRAFPDEAYCIVMVDIDHFKRINDTHGHRGGDVALAHAARMIASAVRISDLVGRYGGEEFCILMRGCELAQASDLAERLVREAQNQVVRLPDARTIGYTLSVGYAGSAASAGLNAPPESLTDVIEHADRALYQAKRQGRNCSVRAARSESTEDATSSKFGNPPKPIFIS